MKKSMLFLFAAAFMLVLGGTAPAQDQTPPPVKPVATTASPTTPAPSAQAVKPAAARPADSVPLPFKPATAPTPAPQVQAVARPANPVPTPHKAPAAVTALPAEVPAFAHPAPSLTPYPAAASPAPPVATAAMIEAAPGVAVLVEQTPPPKEAVAATAPASRAVPQPEQPGQAQTAPPAKPEKEPVMRTEIIRFQYAEKLSVHAMLVSHKSRWGVVTITDKNTIVVTDTPEIIEKMISIVKEIDGKPVEIQFTVQLIQGMETEGPGDEALKNDPVIRELRSVLRYKTFSLLDGTLVRVTDDNDTETKFGPKGDYVIRLKPKYVKDGSNETIQTVIQLREKGTVLTPQRIYNDLIQTTLQLKAGEKTVVGVSKSDSDRGLILILSAKVIK